MKKAMVLLLFAVVLMASGCEMTRGERAGVGVGIGAGGGAAFGAIIGSAFGVPGLGAAIGAGGGALIGGLAGTLAFDDDSDKAEIKELSGQTMTREELLRHPRVARVSSKTYKELTSYMTEVELQAQKEGKTVKFHIDAEGVLRPQFSS